MFSYTQAKISFGEPCGTDDPPPLELPLVGGNCTYVARGIDAPVQRPAGARL